MGLYPLVHGGHCFIIIIAIWGAYGAVIMLLKPIINKVTAAKMLNTHAIQSADAKAADALNARLRIPSTARVK